jgi:hypothetical protein
MTLFLIRIDHFLVTARSKATKQSSLFALMDYFAEPVIGRAHLRDLLVRNDGPRMRPEKTRPMLRPGFEDRVR